MPDYQHPLMRGCVLWLPLCEGKGSTAFDLALYRNSAARSGSGTIWTPGERGWAAAHQGTNDYWAAADSPLWDTGPEITVAARVRYTAATGGDGVVLHDNSNYKWLIYATTDYQTGFYVRTTSTYTSGLLALGANTWYSLVGTYKRYSPDGYRVKLYVNGVLRRQGVGNNADIAEGDEGVYIGRYGSNYIAADIYDVRVWNRALDASEVRLLHCDPWAPLGARRVRALAAAPGGAANVPWHLFGRAA